ncbi:SH3 domain-containing protein [Altererythrobacter sp. H2]|uniref:SH3 domain-containing protein n=1 Tax=Altererythrobacter sp. H2 TaxID=3108391 RepID=UPI002B4BA54D|nr:SH3 domain-containing protein [Altererythrobacter sp. H2]WRK94730.1 SH3 domain-containing protein [Altererythrobacter sp. H2]
MAPRILSLFALLALIMGAPLAAQQREVPYWATIRAPELYMRVGPSPDYKIAWVYKRPGLPLKVVRVSQGWRLVVDPEGEQGWVSASLLSPDRGAVVIGEGLAALRAGPDDSAKLRWNAEPGVIGKLGKCEYGWCKFDVGGRVGWVRAERLWGSSDL